ncbi:MAG: hypothetical protein HYU41_15950 [Candidatus Rokubacteria bacterium]|nr:hypothetical protein [Candidatus Rokubacteria bacterium]
MRRRAAWLGVVVGLVAGASAAPATESRPRTTDSRPDAELLLQLDLLREADLAKQRDLYRRMPVVERLRLLEQLGVLDHESDVTPSRKGGSQK